jgi:Tfp pilus assembly protein PilF
MPERNFMVVDPRRDHSIRVPRPDLSVRLGTPNACNGCHQDQTPSWASEQIVAWFGPRRPDDPHFGVALAAGKEGKPQGEHLLMGLVQRRNVGPIVRASAATLLGRYTTPASRELLQKSLLDPEPLVRMAAVRSLDHLPTEELSRVLAPLLNDRVRVVRTETARVLTSVPKDTLSKDDQPAFQRALAEYETAQIATADQAGAHLNLGVLYGNLRQPQRAKAEYETALRIDSRFVPARLNLAMLYDQLHDKAAAERTLREVIALDPKLVDAHYSLGLLLAENKDRLNEATEALGTAARLDPTRGRVLYNYGLALQQLSRPREAEAAFLAAREREPASADYVYALAVLCVQQQRWDDAKRWAEELIRLDPSNPEWRAFWTTVVRSEK